MCERKGRVPTIRRLQLQTANDGPPRCQKVRHGDVHDLGLSRCPGRPETKAGAFVDPDEVGVRRGELVDQGQPTGFDPEILIRQGLRCREDEAGSDRIQGGLERDEPESGAQERECGSCPGNGEDRLHRTAVGVRDERHRLSSNSSQGHEAPSHPVDRRIELRIGEHPSAVIERGRIRRPPCRLPKGIVGVSAQRPSTPRQADSQEHAVDGHDPRRTAEGRNQGARLLRRPDTPERLDRGNGCQ